LGRTEKENQSRTFLENIHEVWNKKGYKNKPKYALLCTILRTNMGRLIALSILTVCIAIFEVLSVVLIKYIINYFQGVELGLPLVFYCISFLVIKFLSIIMNRQNLLNQVSTINNIIFLGNYWI